MVRKRKPITVDELHRALKSTDPDRAAFAFMEFSKQPATKDSIPVLRKALGRRDPMVVRCAADALRKLGPAAEAAVGDLYIAAKTADESGVPQSYPECVRALAVIKPDEEAILDLVSHWSGVTNWEIVSAGMSALQIIGTPRAMALLKRIHTFWYSELNKTQQKKADKFLKPLK